MRLLWIGGQGCLSQNETHLCQKGGYGLQKGGIVDIVRKYEGSVQEGGAGPRYGGGIGGPVTGVLGHSAAHLSDNHLILYDLAERVVWIVVVGVLMARQAARGSTGIVLTVFHTSPFSRILMSSYGATVRRYSSSLQPSSAPMASLNRW